MYRFFFKRVIDIVLALMALIVLSPIILILAFILFIANGGTPFFTQARPGKSEKIFILVKFKTMNERKDKDGNLLSDEKRLTKVGRFIRQSSLDELPQLINVFLGNMSIIGPRPLVPEYLPFYNDRHRRRHEIRPGITGLAQVSGRQSIKFSQRFDLDVEYVDNLSLWLDIKIIFKTLKKIVAKEHIIHGQTVDDVDDLGITKNLAPHHFREKK